MKKKTSPVREKIQNPSKNTGPLSILSNLLFDIMRDMKLGEMVVWERYMSRFVNDPINAIPNVKPGQITSARGNLRKELMKPIISWRVFCKGMRFLNLHSFTIVVKVVDKTGIQSAYERTVLLTTEDAVEETNAKENPEDDE